MKRLELTIAAIIGLSLASVQPTLAACPVTQPNLSDPACLGPFSSSNKPCYAVLWSDAGDLSDSSYCVFQGDNNSTQSIPGFDATVSEDSGNPGHWTLSLTNRRSTGFVKSVKFPYMLQLDPWPHPLPSPPPPAYYCANAGAFKIDASDTDISDNIIIDSELLGVASRQQSKAIGQWGTLRSYGGARVALGLYAAGRGSSPYMIQTDKRSARILAATNWEPTNVWMTWACQGWFLWYPELNVANGQTRTFSFLLETHTGGFEPWIDAANDYADWLRPKYQNWKAHTASSVEYPSWMTSGNLQGFMNFQLQSSPDASLTQQVETDRWLADVASTGKKYRDYLPWALFWGEMSDYYFDCHSPSCPGSGDSACGCCGGCRRLHPRYTAADGGSCTTHWDISNFIQRRITGALPELPPPAGDTRFYGHAGFYTRPYGHGEGTSADVPPLIDPPPGTVVNDAPDCDQPASEDTGDCAPFSSCALSGYPHQNETPLHWFQQWNTISRNEWKANSTYFDILGGVYFGEPLAIANLFASQALPMDALMEAMTDVYPLASLAGGSLDIPGAPGGPGHSRLEDMWNDSGIGGIPLPEVGNVILGDRLFFNGAANSGYLHWGICHDYWTERQAFLLGHKFDVLNPFEQVGYLNMSPAWTCPYTQSNQDTVDNELKYAADHCTGDWEGDGSSVNQFSVSCPNLAMMRAIEQRVASNWWAVRPVYQHKKGLRAVPPGVDIRSYDANGAAYLVVDNWHRKPGNFCFNNVLLPVPSERLKILVPSDLVDSDGDHVGDSLEPRIIDSSDTDGDGVIAACDNCPSVSNPNQLDVDEDGWGDVCDDCNGPGIDPDHDSVCSSVDNCMFAANASQSDIDDDGLGDACDNCPTVDNLTQSDWDDDDIGDACDLCPEVATPDNSDVDHDGLGGGCDNCPGTANPGQDDAEMDGVGDACDNCLSTANPDQGDCDGDHQGDACEPTLYIGSATSIVVAAEDGYVTANTNGSAGTATNNANPLYTGDFPGLGSQKMYRTVLSFDTNALGPNDQIRSAQLTIFRYSNAGNGGLGAVMVDIAPTSGFGGNMSLAVGDFSATAAATLSESFGIPGIDNYSSVIDLVPSEWHWINRNGHTQFRLRHVLDTDNDGTADRVGWYQGESASGSYKPKLVVGYISCQ